MKHSALLHRSIPAAAVASALLFCTTSQARPPAAPSGSGNNPAPRSIPAGQASELGLVRDGFQAYRNLQLDGDAFFSKTEKGVHAHYRRTYRAIETTVVRERITMEQAQAFLTSLLDIGAAHAEEPGETDTRLSKLNIDLETAITDRADAEKMTPEVNRIEWLMEEIVRYAKSGALRSSAASKLERELDALLDEEESAKSGSNFRERERRELVRTTLETWIRFVRLAQA